MEAEFKTQLNEALRKSVAGHWGIFGQNDHLWPGQTASSDLIHLGEEIRRLRSDLGIPHGFQPYERFLFYRGQHGCNVAGEPRLAAALLQELSTLDAD